MAFILIGVVLLVLKLTEFGPVGQWAWWIVLAPFACAVVWWAWADASGYNKRRAMDAMDAKRTERRRRNMESLGTTPRRK